MEAQCYAMLAILHQIQMDNDVITTLSEEVALAQAAKFWRLKSVVWVTSGMRCKGGRWACEGMTQGNLDKIQTIQIVGTMLTLAMVGDCWQSFATAWQGGRRKGCASVEGSRHSQADRPC